MTIAVSPKLNNKGLCPKHNLPLERSLLEIQNKEYMFEICLECTYQANNNKDTFPRITTRDLILTDLLNN